ncbi:MAG: undecaprenyl/decaprenyl-phosphate alpha-N-acetylglucosaminyl 1-phosphate transferase [Flavobacteriales bacterium]|nr:undecaprenyl/decaprenyl-phosphate alpha-N-acetylglucosaminyl 1-phosphate transferase [Flavobacteriales bacterium]MCB9364036.1 undecaprenyl/decaprenyl-phosphate alpha-N-acetylglucosaminyl 1-phosphate transferase [Flavobacteriales bacterium]
MPFPLKHILFFVGAVIFSFLINHILLRFVKTLGIRNEAETHIRWSSQVKPALGGLTFYIIFLLSITLHPFVFSYSGEAIDFQFTGIIGVTSLGFLMGLADDAYNTKPMLKLFTQILCGVLLAYSGTYIQVFDNDIINYSLTVLWVVGLMNSINMLDNMDGITTVVSLIIAFTIFVIMLNNNEFDTISMTVVIGLLGSLFGFLYFNWNPSKMYMGDTGSQYLGVLLAALSINYLWNPVTTEEFSVSRQFLIPLLSFIIPIIDTTTVVIKRVRKGNSPFVGGKDHTTHHLSYLGLSEKQVAGIITLISIVSSLIVIYVVSTIKVWSHLYTVIFVAYFLILFFILFYVANKNIDKSE